MQEMTMTGENVGFEKAGHYNERRIVLYFTKQLLELANKMGLNGFVSNPAKFILYGKYNRSAVQARDGQLAVVLFRCPGFFTE